MRRLLGLLLAGAGAALLLFVGVDYARGAIARDHARSEWDRAAAQRAVAAADRFVRTVATHATLARGEPVGRIIIPAIDLDEVVIEGVGPAQLDIAPGHLPQSPLPGENGNAVISAHRDRQFHGLDRLALGDTVVTETVVGRVAWVVVGRRVVERGEPVLYPTTDPTLTLTTCWPVHYVGPAPDRLIVTAKPLRPPGAPSAGS